MTIGIDSSPFHRIRWSTDAILRFVSGLDVSRVSLEIEHLPALDRTYLCALRGTMRSLGMEPVLTWRPSGSLREKDSGTRDRDLLESLEAAVLVGASVLRIVDEGGVADAALFASITPVAARQGVTMALENSARWTSADLLTLLDEAGSESLGVSFDIAAALQAQEDVPAAVSGLGRWIRIVQATDRACLPVVVASLRGSGYSGSLMARIDAEAPEDMIRESVHHLKELARG